MKRVVAAVVVLLATWVGTANAAINPKQAWLLDRAADYWRSHGVTLVQHRVDQAPTVTGSAAEVAVPRHGTPTVRYQDRMVWQPRASAAFIALHEMVHVAQAPAFTDGGYRRNPGWFEGMADALASDHLCPFMARTWGRATALRECHGWGGSYPRESAVFRAYSAQATGYPGWSYPARMWRLYSLREVSR